ncbi:MAG: Na/Pi cotransporter family protein [Lachnospiraceae bacterium]|nr:Na/Pi cotransporter family protein [Lachnospiraceae bacterium]
MDIFNIISLLGGLALFLYGMKLMGNSLKEGSSGTLKVIMEKVTNNPIKAFLLGLVVTAVIQSSTATIVITSGLVAAGIISLRQSLGIIIGANVGTTVTGQIIRLLDVSSEGTSVLKLFTPSTLAPLALVIGVLLVMFLKFNKSENIGNVCIGFGILFTGLMNMTAAVSTLTEGGLVSKIFLSLGNNPLLGYLAGAGVAFVLQSSSATIGILQAFAMAESIPFKTVYIILVGVYLGDCVTTAIVCSIGAKPDQKRVGMINILYNLSKTVLVIVAVVILYNTGVLDNLWESSMTPGSIANANSIFNLGCAVLLLPLVGVYEKLSKVIVKDVPQETGKYSEKLAALNPVFFSTPALALRSIYDVLRTMLEASINNIDKAMNLIYDYKPGLAAEIEKEENAIDQMTDVASSYMMKLSPHVKEELHMKILDQYYKDVTEFERLGDHAVNLMESARELAKDDSALTDDAKNELDILRRLLSRILENASLAFIKRDVVAARHIEPMEEVVDDLVNSLHDNHIVRLRDGKCKVNAGIVFLDILTNLERISDICSNIGVATIARATPGVETLAHSYISSLHQGNDAEFNMEYSKIHSEYYKMFEEQKSDKTERAEKNVKSERKDR